MLDLLKEYLRAKIKDPNITKHAVLYPVGRVCMKLRLYTFY